MKKKRVAAGTQIKNSPILGHPANSVLTCNRQFQSSPIRQVNHSVGNIVHFYFPLKIYLQADMMHCPLMCLIHHWYHPFLHCYHMDCLSSLMGGDVLISVHFLLHEPCHGKWTVNFIKDTFIALYWATVKIFAAWNFHKI